MTLKSPINQPPWPTLSLNQSHLVLHLICLRVHQTKIFRLFCSFLLNLSRLSGNYMLCWRFAGIHSWTLHLLPFWLFTCLWVLFDRQALAKCTLQSHNLMGNRQSTSKDFDVQTDFLARPNPVCIVARNTELARVPQSLKWWIYYKVVSCQR